MTPMEFSKVSELFVDGYTAKKKRSGTSRRPRRHLGTLLETHLFLPKSTQSTETCGSEGNLNRRESIVGPNGLGCENKLKLKLKFGGVTHTIQTNSTVDYAFGSGPFVTKSSHCFHAPQPRQKQKANEVQPKGNYIRGKTYGFGASVNKPYEGIRKSKRVPKRRALGVEFDEENNDEDDELRYLGRLDARISAGYDDRIIEDKDDMEEEEEPTSIDVIDSRRRMEKGYRNSFIEGIIESSIPTTRNRAYKTAKDVSARPGASLLEFPDGLPPASSKKQKEKLTDMEQQLKKAEAAQRRRMQSEKAAREAEAEAIRKILGQDSARKKKEDKLKKQRDQLAQGKASKSNTLASNTVRWIFRPTGTVVLFSEDIGLPNIFNSAPSSYPPAREKCAAPNCTNSYKYRDSKSKLPLCSLQCYKAIHEKMQSPTMAF